MITKKQLIKSIKKMPESFSVDAIIDRILLLEKIGIGISQSKAGQVHSTIIAKQKLRKYAC